VPTSHATENLRTAIGLAARLGCPLVALCSKLASASRAKELGAERGIELLAIDIARVPPTLLPDFATYRLLQGTEFAHQRDTSAKRNLGLLLAGTAGWQRVVFLDDDIDVPDPDDLERAAKLLDEYDVVGLNINHFPDNSVVCHANRQTGGVQATFIGGGALAVGVSPIISFFPNVYNEDWFFLLDGDQLRPSAMIGTALQEAYDPYATEVRATAEEFGDSLAEGLFWLLDQGRPLKDATESYWREFLPVRWAFIRELIDRVDQNAVASAPTTERMRRALLAALRRSERITPELCVAYLAAWREDREDWRQHVDELKEPRTGTDRLRPSGATEASDLARTSRQLGLADCCHYLGLDD
jgi:hypothetical protein